MRLCINDARVKSYLSTVKYEGQLMNFYGQDMANCSLMFKMKALKRGITIAPERLALFLFGKFIQ